MNLKSKINLLQRALQTKGIIILINRKQIYLSKQDCICTVYNISEEENGKFVKIYETFSQIEVVRFLAAKLKAVQNNG